MNDDEFWTLLAALMPDGIEVLPDGSEALVKGFGKKLGLVRDEEGNSYTINGKTIHFEDTEAEVVNTMLVPFILQELDGQRRI